jgi:hypothetical protein
MGYFDNEILNKYEEKFKNKKIINLFLLIQISYNFIII